MSLQTKGRPTHLPPLSKQELLVCLYGQTNLYILKSFEDCLSRYMQITKKILVSKKKKGDTVKYLLLISIVIRILFYAEFVAGSL